MCAAPPPVSSAMMCFCLFSYPQMSEISRLFSSFSSSSLHLRPHSGSAFQSANSSPERLTLCLVTKTLIALSLSSQAHSLISAPEYLRNAECWSVECGMAFEPRCMFCALIETSNYPISLWPLLHSYLWLDTNVMRSASPPLSMTSSSQFWSFWGPASLPFS